MSNNEEILAMLDDLNMYVYPPAPHTDKTPEEILDSIFDKHFSSSEDDSRPTFDFTVEHAQNTYYNLPPHLNKYASSAKPIIIDQKYKVDFNPKATTSHILNNLGMFVSPEGSFDGYFLTGDSTFSRFAGSGRGVMSAKLT